MENIPSHDVITVHGDFKARVGSKNEERGRTIRKEGIEYITDWQQVA